jgi:hypothetical protein
MAAGWKLGALLTELRQGRLHDTSSQVPGAYTDYLWEDDQLVRYINEACRRFARKSLVIRDGTSSITKFTTVDSQEFYPLDPSIVAVLSVRQTGGASTLQPLVINPADPQDLVRAGHDGFDTYHTPDLMFFDVNTLVNLLPGKPLAWATDEDVIADPNGSFGVMNLRLYPICAQPYDGNVCQMRVIREPINDLLLSNLSAYPEIPASHHLDMLDWAAYLALSNVDTDVAGANAPERAEKFKASFEQHCLDARKEVMRKLFTPMQWGFGQNGFTWEPNI